MSAPSAQNLATRLRQVRLARRADQTPKLPATWDVIKVGLTVPTIAWLAVLVVVVITKAAAGAGFSGLGAATAAGWLIANQTPLTIGGVAIGVLPLVPTLLVGFGTYRVVRRATVDATSFNELLRIAGTAVLGPLLATALALAVVADGASSGPVGNPAPLGAFGMTVVVHGVAAIGGLLPRVTQPFLDEFAIPASDRVGARAGTAAFFVLIAGGGIAVFAGFVAHFGAVADILGLGNTFDGYLGLTVLSILYLPNVVVSAAAVTAGASATLGGLTVDAFSTHPGTLPPVPIAGVVPTSDLGPWGAVLFAVPLVGGVLLGWYTRSDDVVAHLRAVGVGASVASGLMVVAVALSGGRLGEMGQAGVSVPLAGVFTLTALGVTALLTVGVLWLRSSTAGRSTRRSSAIVADDPDELVAEDEDLEADDPDIDGSPEDDDAAADDDRDDQADPEWDVAEPARDSDAAV
ncbi:DUF6350 family protein [Gordonia neofelifaecis]|uniref:Uncharacterized protein n=1 Tax=Gordonia neofelifaecis NRRL B-59395 TaxID=644548 RepID=F1YKN0_9ACTN|nr:DUF6350 family protein [Gordonia neofelifaecis]EGD54674.1 hypothetical protein SCNU_12317 [Gordonia neofelifaecis NRRL B-59395]